MALIQCPECGKEISDQAKMCVHCGFELQQKVEEQPLVLQESVEEKIPDERESERYKKVKSKLSQMTKKWAKKLKATYLISVGIGAGITVCSFIIAAISSFDWLFFISWLFLIALCLLVMAALEFLPDIMWHKEEQELKDVGADNCLYYIKHTYGLLTIDEENATALSGVLIPASYLTLSGEKEKRKTEFIIRACFFTLMAIPLVVVMWIFGWKLIFDGMDLKPAIADMFGSAQLGLLIAIIYLGIWTIVGNVMSKQFEKKHQQRLKEWAESVTKNDEIK